jgi:hypothetical protein
LIAEAILESSRGVSSEKNSLLKTIFEDLEPLIDLAIRVKCLKEVTSPPRLPSNPRLFESEPRQYGDEPYGRCLGIEHQLLEALSLGSKGFLQSRGSGLMKANVQNQFFGHGFSIPESNQRVGCSMANALIDWWRQRLSAEILGHPGCSLLDAFF